MLVRLLPPAQARAATSSRAATPLSIVVCLLSAACVSSTPNDTRFESNDESIGYSASPLRDPVYAPPMVRDHQVELSLPAGYTLRDAWLVVDDTSGGRDTQLPLITNHRPQPGVQRQASQPGSERLTFDLPLWKPGLNRSWVRAHVVNGQAVRRIESQPFERDYALPRAFGSTSAPGRFQLPSAFPRNARACQGLPCKDRDGDGLGDLWENVALHQLRPTLMLDHGDELFDRKQDAVTVMTSVKPLFQNGVEYVVFASVVAFSRDYGYLFGWDHAGDAETFGMLFRVERDDSLQWIASVTKGHPCVTCKQRYQRHAQDFDEDGTPLVFVERNKHGLWQSGRACRTRSGFACRGDRSLRPEANNVGDDTPDGSHRLVDAFDDTRGDGPFARIAKLFPGDAVWSAHRARVKGTFCGGRNLDCARSSGATMPGVIFGKLIALFASELP